RGGAQRPHRRRRRAAARHARVQQLDPRRAEERHRLAVAPATRHRPRLPRPAGGAHGRHAGARRHAPVPDRLSPGSARARRALLELPDDWPRAYGAATRVAAALAVVLVGVHASGGPRARRVALAGIVAPALALVALAPLALSRPTIDVWQWTQHCARALLHGT